ncbi:MAG: hypothetical protein J2P17_09285 [Mycobacterium sp.]|nr:hypothetical protein [Mycobacterium sp.]
MQLIPEPDEPAGIPHRDIGKPANGSATPGRLPVAQVRVLRALNCGGMLTKKQIEGAAGLTKWMTWRAVADLTRRGLIFATARTNRYQITRSGRKVLAVNPPDSLPREARDG